MKISFVIAGLAVLSDVALATENYFEARAAKTCGHYPVKFPKLTNCATATAFCRGYISSVTCTTTKTSTLRVPSAASTTTTTKTITIDGGPGPTETVTAPTSTVSTASTSTLTTLGNGPSCTAPNARRDVEVQGTASCGIYSKADPARVTGACNLFLASSTIKHTTVTTGTADVATVTSSVYTTTFGAPATTTKTPTVTVYTTTVAAQQTACSTACGGSGAFKLKVEAPDSLLDGQFLAVAPLPVAPASTFSILPFPDITTFSIDPSDGRLKDLDTGSFAAVVTTFGGNSPVQFQPSTTPIGTYLSCSIMSDGTLSCTAGAENKFSLLANQIQIGTSVLPLEMALTLRLVCAK